MGGLTPEGHLGPLPRPALAWHLALRALSPLQLNRKPGNLQQCPKIHTTMIAAAIQARLGLRGMLEL